MKDPEDRRHFPRFTKGCWRGDWASCCWFCQLRLLFYPIRHLRDSTDDTDQTDDADDSASWPDLEHGICPATGDMQWIIAYDDGSRECYHCGAEMEEREA